MKNILLIAWLFVASNLFAQDYYAQFILNGWQSFIEIPEYTVPEGATHFTAVAKYAVGESNGGFVLGQINIFLKLANSDFTVEIGAAGSSATSDFVEYAVTIDTSGLASRLQVAGQETSSWGALTGDTLWVGAITVFSDIGEDVIFDPATHDASTLPVGVTIVEIGPPSAVDSRTLQQISLYPNPARSTITVEGIQDIAEINIISLAGSRVMTVKETKVVNIENLAEGIYFIRIQTGNETLTTKFVKQ